MIDVILALEQLKENLKYFRFDWVNYLLFHMFSFLNLVYLREKITLIILHIQ